MLAVVDDVQWVDASSRECLEYVARRAGGRLAVVLAARDPWDALAPGLPELALGPLDDAAAAELLRRAAPGLAPDVAAAIAAAAAGNPLALVELPATLTAEQRAGVAALELPLAPGGAAAARVRGPDSGTRRRPRGGAADRRGARRRGAGPDRRRVPRGRDRRGAAGAGRGARPGAARRRARDLRPSARARSRVPGRAARRAPRRARRARRRAARRAARVAPRGGRGRAGRGRRARARACRQRAAARRAFGPAAAALERAARLSPDPSTPRSRLLAAGQAAARPARRDRALALLEEAARTTAGAGLRARAEHLRGRIMVWSGAPAEATRLLVGEAERLSADDRVLAATMLADAANGARRPTTTCEPRSSPGAPSRCWARTASRPSECRCWRCSAGCWCCAARPPEGRPVLREAERLARDLDPLGPQWPWLHLLLRALIPLGELERARRRAPPCASAPATRARSRTLGGALIVAADVTFRLGDWGAADAAAARGDPRRERHRAARVPRATRCPRTPA